MKGNVHFTSIGNIILFRGTCKVRKEIKTKRNQSKRYMHVTYYTGTCSYMYIQSTSLSQKKEQQTKTNKNKQKSNKQKTPSPPQKKNPSDYPLD